ncbi:MAG TPA: ATP-binding protein [Myxococcaceae bacterium]|jgi:signal transduction histidine kinase
MNDDALAGGGEMGALMRSMDWSRTPLGPVSGWPQSLRTTVSTCLNSRFPILIWWGSEMVKIYNDAYRPMLGNKHPRSMGARGRDVWPEIWDVIGPMLEGVLHQGRATWSENQLLLLHRYGFVEECYFTYSYSPVRDESGGIGGIFCAVTETTGQVLGERRLRALREMAALTTGAHSTGEACRLAAEAIGHHPDDLPFALLYAAEDHGARLAGAAGVPEGDPIGQLQSWQPQLGEVLRTGRPVLVDDLERHLGPVPAQSKAALLLPVCLPGEASPVAVMVFGLSPQLQFDERYQSFLELLAGTLAGAAASARALQDAKRRAEALAELDRAKTAFFSNVSHEFRTPLTLMLGPTEDLLAGAHGALSTDQRAQLELLRRNELRLQRLVNALLEFSRIEAGRAQASFEATDLAALTRDLAGSFRSGMERAGLAFSVDCPPLEEPAFIDHDLWEQIVLNLLSNALKFTFEGRIEVSLRAAGDELALRIKDTGVGIRAEDLPHLFERFHRVEGTRARTHEGSGIGLALVQELVKLHGGTVGVESAPGAGTTFTVRIPKGSGHLPRERLVHREGGPPSLGRVPAFVEEALRWLPGHEVPPEPGAAPVPAGGGEARILVVDDNADMREYVRRILAARWEVELAGDGKAALDAIRSRRPDLVLTDVMMPVLDGFGLLRELRADPALAGVPVVMLSARAGEEARVEGLEAGADDYLVKPFSTRELMARVTTQLRLARAQAAIEHQWEEIRAVLRQLPVAVAIVSIPGERYDFVNEAYVEMVGRDPTGRTIDGAWADLPERDLAHLRELRERVLSSRRPITFQEISRRLPDGSTRHYTASMRAWLDPEGRPRGLISTSIDVTGQVLARLQMEESRAQSVRSEAELHKALALRDDFLTLASHELRTPLTTLGLEAEGLLRSIERAPRADPPLERWAQRAAKVAGQAARLEQLVEGMLDLASLSRELAPGREEELDLADLARGVVDRFRNRSKQARSTISLLAEPVAGRWDRRRLERILTQLLGNALKFGADNPIDVSVGPAAERARIAIRDRGIGIPPEDLQRIFGRFERAAPAEHYGGFGVGLWLVGELVKSMAGTVRVDSRPGQGSTFVIDLPRHP